MRITLTVVLALVVFSLATPRAHAQVVRLDEPELDYSASHADARYVANVGMGLTITGISAVATGSAMFFPLGFVGYIAGGTFWGLGTVFGAIGIPTWVAGGVRAAITGQSSAEGRRSEAHRWKVTGVGLFCAGLGLMTIGAVLLGASIGTGNDWSRDAAIAGAFLVPIGVFVAMFIGAPMWGEGARF